MLSLVYISSATHPFSDPEIRDLLVKARKNNTRLGITGMLAYQDGNFIQVLEGADEAVQELFETIRKDDRHKGAIALLNNQIDQRQFSEWSMAFQNLNDPALRELPGYSEFMNEPLGFEQFRSDPCRARRLFEVFRRNTRR